MQALRAGCSKAEPKNFAPPQTPFPEPRDSQNLITGDGHYLYLQTEFGEDRCTHFRVIMVTDTHTNKQTQTHTNRQDRLLYTAPLASAQCNNAYYTILCPKINYAYNTKNMLAQKLIMSDCVL